MSLFEDTYLTIETPCEGGFKDKGSKFIAYAYPFGEEAALKEIIAELRALHPKARHHCWAYRLTPDRSVFRLNDDGEPSGTAGRPILNTLLSYDVTNILVVVVRYFGGTLLGVPGLINAYKTATQEALGAGKIVTKTVNDVYRITFDYLQMNDVMRLVKEENLPILKQEFDNNCSMDVEVRKLLVNQVIQKLDNLDGVHYAYLHTL
ncbi:YigZ family protein [Sphingobacterium sp. DN00404]|uniref:YigZ family protein n=1 Tax=Sphingobacterium micropteri TaxID=2763501 RepID=A0ABR7YLG3_9SPHI|nr:YigZ family protein [Sphingobacterium micropteri]MBD1432155.1 YigZ family protein [Sphingobacterium micropteri]